MTSLERWTRAALLARSHLDPRRDRRPAQAHAGRPAPWWFWAQPPGRRRTWSRFGVRVPGGADRDGVFAGLIFARSQQPVGIQSAILSLGWPLLYLITDTQTMFMICEVLRRQWGFTV